MTRNERPGRAVGGYCVLQSGLGLVSADILRELKGNVIMQVDFERREVASLSDAWNKRRYVIAIIVILVIHMIFILFYGMLKIAFHEDEYFTYYTSTGHNVINPYGAIQEKSGGEILLGFVVTEENRFHFLNVAGVQTTDNHPPLYYISLHFLMSLFPLRFYKWFGIVLNGFYSLVSCLGILFFVYRLDRSDHRYFISLLAALLYAVHPAVISNVMFTRMYAMSVMWTVLYMDVFVLVMQNLLCSRKRFARLALCGAAVCYFAFLTHYFTMYVLFLLTLGFCIYAAVRKFFFKEKCFARMLVYGGSLVAAIGLAILTFPFAIRQIFFQGDGPGTLDRFFNAPTSDMLKLFLPILDKNFFAGMMYPALGLLAASIVAKIALRIKKRSRGGGECAEAAATAIGLVSGFICVWLLCKTSQFLGDEASRYFYSVAALLMPLMVYSICSAVLQVTERWAGKRLRIFLSAILSLIVLLPAIAGHVEGNVLYLYRDKEEVLRYANDNAQYPVVMVYNQEYRYRTWYMANELWPYEKVVYVRDDEEETVLDSEILKTAEKLIVYMDNPVEILDRLVEQNPNLSSWSLLRHDSLWYVYVLE